MNCSGAAAGNLQQAQAMASMLSLPVSILVLAGIVNVLLPTSFPRSLAVAALYWLIAIVLAVIIAVIFGILAAVVIRAA